MSTSTKRSKLRKSARVLLIVSLVICLLSSLFASLIQTAGGKVKIEHLHQAFTYQDPAVTPSKVTLDALIYKPKNATKENPAPVIFNVHGTINNKEFQDINAIELARRGFVVVAFDLVAHGESEVTSLRADGAIQLIEYVAGLDYVDGNNVGISGHSRGGGISMLAADFYNYKGQQAFAKVLEAASVTEETATEEQLAEAKAAMVAANRVKGCLSVSCTPYTGTPGSSRLTDNCYSEVTSVGVIAGQYDEFFFKYAGKYTEYNNLLPATDPNTTNAKKYEFYPIDYLTTDNAAKFISDIYPEFAVTERHTVPVEGEPGYDATLPVPANNPVIKLPASPVEAGTYYTAEGKANITAQTPSTTPFRVIYTPDVTHPQAHLSVKAAANQIDFFYGVFGIPAGAEYIESSNQTWLVKEIINFIGFIGIVLFIIAFAEVILIIPFFSRLRRQGGIDELAVADEYALSPDALGLNEDLPELKGWKRHLLLWIPGIATSLICGITIRYFTSSAFGFGSELLPNSTWFNQSYINQIAVWTMLITILILVTYALSQWIFGCRLGDKPFAKGRISSANFGRAILAAALVVGAAYLIELFSNKVFKTDYRFWTLAFKAFSLVKLPTILRYSCLFAGFYIVNALINANIRYKNVPEWATILIAILFNLFGIVLMMFIQYNVLFTTGHLWQEDASLLYVVLFPIVPMLMAAALIARKIYLRSGNIWFAGFVNTFFMTIIMCANTSAASKFPYIFF